MKDILVPVDFSAHANKALDFAVQIAKKSGVKLLIMHACDAPVIMKDGEDFQETGAGFSFINVVEERLALISQSIREAEGVAVETRVYTGPAIDMIRQAAITHDIGLIVMGTLGESGIRERILGSRTAKLIGKTKIPVLAVPFLCEWTPPKKILLAVNDFDEESETTRMAVELAALFNATLHAAIFTDVDSEGIYEYLEQGKDIKEYESDLRKQYQYESTSAVHLEGHRFLEALDQYITQNEIDIVAMVTHKRNFTGGLFHRSLTKKMSYHTRIPLLALPAS